jgi:quercetin dioxygenase-like cupin family protein
LEKVYHVLEGEITVKSKTETFVLAKGDTLYLGPNEGREVINATNMPASMLVVINYPE